MNLSTITVYIPVINIQWSNEVAQSCLTPCEPLDYSLPGSSIHGIFQARVLEWVFFYMLCHKLCTACQSRSCPSASEEGGRQPVISTGHTEMSFFFFLNTPYGTWELSSPTRDRTWALCIVSVLSEPGTTGESQHWLEFKLFLLKMYNRWLIVFIGKCGQSWIKKMFPQINVLKFTIRN